MIDGQDVLLRGVRAGPREDIVHGLARGIKGFELERSGMGLEVFLATLGEGQGACVVGAGRMLALCHCDRGCNLREFVQEAEVLSLIAQVNLCGCGTAEV